MIDLHYGIKHASRCWHSFEILWCTWWGYRADYRVLRTIT